MQRVVRAEASFAQKFGRFPPSPAPAVTSLHIAFNKVDRLNSETLALAKQKYPEAVFMSATHQLGLDTLRQRLLQLIDEPVEAISVTQGS